MTPLEKISIIKENNYKVYSFWCNATFHDGKTVSKVSGSVVSTSEQCAFDLFKSRLTNLGWKKVHYPVELIVTDNPFSE